MKRSVVTGCLCILSLLAVAIALPLRRSASKPAEHHHSKHHDELGDMRLFPQQKQQLQESRNGKNKRGAPDTDIIRIWPDGTVPYVMDPKIIGTVYEKSFKKAIATWEKHTCVKFVNRSNEKYFIILTNSSMCESWVGFPYEDVSYKVTLGELCSSAGNAMHELGHVLGFFHEHQRPDRDDWITINQDAMQNTKQARNAFEKYSRRINSLGVEYDYASIMHYSRKAFSKNGSPVFRVKKGKTLPNCLPEIGQRVSISSKDILQVNKLYKCPAKMNQEKLDDCALFNPTEIRKKNIKTTNEISLGLDEDTWVSCRTGRCFKQACKANFDKRKKRNTYTTWDDTCTDHQFTIRTTIQRARSDKVKVGDNITLEWKPGRFLDCSSVAGACSMTVCNQMDFEGSNTAEECPNHIFRIASETKEVGDIVQTHDEIQLEYVRNGYHLDCSGSRCVVRPYQGCTAPSRVDDGHEISKDQIPEDQVNCKPPSFTIQK